MIKITECPEWNILIEGFHNYYYHEEEYKLRFDLAFKIYFQAYDNRTIVNDLSNESGVGIYLTRELLHEELRKEYEVDK